MAGNYRESFRAGAPSREGGLLRECLPPSGGDGRSVLGPLREGIESGCKFQVVSRPGGDRPHLIRREGRAPRDDTENYFIKRRVTGRNCRVTSDNGCSRRRRRQAGRRISSGSDVINQRNERSHVKRTRQRERRRDRHETVQVVLCLGDVPVLAGITPFSSLWETA